MGGDSVRVGHPGSHIRNVQSTDGRSQVMYRLGEQCLREWHGMRGYGKGSRSRSQNVGVSPSQQRLVSTASSRSIHTLLANETGDSV